MAHRLAVRMVNEQFSSPFRAPQERSISTRPGETVVEDRHGFYVAGAGGAGRLASRARPLGYRVLLMQVDEADILRHKSSGFHELRIRRGHVVRELEESELLRLCRGEDLYDVVNYCPNEETLAEVREGFALVELIELAVSHWTHAGSVLHGVGHWTRVATIGEELAAKTSHADVAVIHAFGAFHDCQRVNDGPDPDHGRRAAALVRELDLGLDDEQTATLVDAISDHADGKTSTNPTIGCCWDADRLDLRRLGRRPKPALLSTAAALEMFG